jgi:glycosyltransferase involved in cell wall biosynthesis
VNIGILAAGAGGMYCGSCMRDNDMAMALKRLGHAVTLVPLYTPLRTENQSDASEVFYGGINVYLQHASSLFRHTPRAFDWLFDRPWLLGMAGSLGAQTPPEKLAEFTLDIVRGEEGTAHKELHRLIAFLKEHVRPQVISLPNLMFIGMARLFRQELGVPVVCEMTGEDIFLDAMHPADRQRMQTLIRQRIGDVSRFVATSDYYAGRMAEYLGVDLGQIDVVYTGVAKEYLEPLSNGDAASVGRPPTVGYLARICPEKGFDQVLAAMEKLVELPGMSGVRLVIAGYLGSRDAKWAKAILQKIADSPLRDSVTFLGEVDRRQKLEMLNSIDVFTVPTRYPEAKGVYVLEALARGVPVVQPNHGAFPELLQRTGGGLLTPPGDAAALAKTLAELLGDPPRGREMGRRGRAAIESQFTDEQMARGMLKVFESVTK